MGILDDAKETAGAAAEKVSRSVEDTVDRVKDKIDEVKADADVQVSPVVVESTVALAGSVKPGSLVDVWAAEQQDDGSFAPPTIIVSDAGVVRVIEQRGLVSPGEGDTVEILVPTGHVAALLAALSGESAISIVPAG